MLIRDETSSDEAAIRRLIADAFRDKSFSHQTEHFIVDALRRMDALSLSLVAEEAGGVVGHVAFSPIAINGQPTDWFALGPVAVAPDRQRAGIGSALIREGLARLHPLAAGGCVVLGNPAYYERFGFRSSPRLTYDGAPARDFMVMAFGDSIPTGKIAFHPAFDVTG